MAAMEVPHPDAPLPAYLYMYVEGISLAAHTRIRVLFTQAPKPKAKNQ